MTIQQKKAFVREEIIKVVPEILELKFGCEVETIQYNEYDSGRMFVIAEIAVCKKHKNYREECYEEENGCSVSDALHVAQITEEEGWILRTFKHDELKIIGRPIQIADFLRTLNTLRHDGSYIITDAGIFALFKAEGALVDKALKVFSCTWDFTKDFDHQPDPFVEWAYEVLKN